MSSRTVALVLAVLAASSGGACNRGQTAGPPPAMPPTPVSLAIAKAAPVDDTTEYVATLKSLHSTAVQPQTDGQITEILVKSGDRVRRGARLMQIDARRQRAAVSSQEAERASRQEAVAFARQQAQRTRELLAAGAISKEDLQRTRSA